ncbi:MAG: type II toxin-antitoxin system RelE/ParE family toxin [Proteobacteria bacterium]|nr:type II toxin-antitoxin system RelE/ParE family toxin [Pseudomonadota bacterium]MBU1387860.1 type II toxin-antitoxin system RelE/ParE family toxin [Pseudomonadota bacterium]MBU1543237.1 type II toxin-antitoxin system RelE/ParE family toxin [Pseudomonadota bacterium]MBU2482470.1 type II toxin-antitoxin system RelE/ParE family toxin [Pseudomonadota bacterium]
MKVQFTPSARNQFLSALAYIQRDKPSAAVDFRNKAETILRRLEVLPDSGRMIPEFPELPCREVIVSPYRFFYKVKDDIVWIIAVWHGVQLPKEPNP